MRLDTASKPRASVADTEFLPGDKAGTSVRLNSQRWGSKAT